jgi:hypothetical protein
MPTISVIVPTRQRHHLLVRALQSLRAQTFADFEILLVDDNPRESRVRHERSLESLIGDPRVRVIEHDQPRNAAAARNCALRQAGGEWITFLDDDDAYAPEKLEKQWHRAQATGLPIGMCGIVYHLKGRQRVRQVSADEVRGGDLLISYQALPSLFHRRSPGVLFHEDLFAGEDAHYFCQVIAHFKADRVFNVAEPLVDIYPQPGPRVNTNAEGLWLAAQLIHREFAPAYGEETARLFLARARLGYLKLQKGDMPEMLRLAFGLVRLGGMKELRIVLNALLFRWRWARRFLVG